MKLLVLRSAMLALLISLVSQGFSQERPTQNRPPQPPIILHPATHPSETSKPILISPRSFYKSKADWGHIVDSTWGPGLPLYNKLQLFDTYAASLSNTFDGFQSLGLNWDSLRAHYRSKIDSSTSRGHFSAIMTRFSMCLRDAHTVAVDTIVAFTPLSPGVPVLVLTGWATAEHFGAVLTTLPDSSAVVLRTVPNHPLGLEPGDIVLGYQGIPWRTLVKELLDAEIPILSEGVGSRSAETHALLRNVGNNWHLFDTIDIVKFSTKETQHLPVSPLVTLPPDPILGNEQLAIAGIPFEFYDITPSLGVIGQPLQYGRLPSTDVGYIRLLGEWPTGTADALMNTAVNELWDTKGLIIDMRYNVGGWALFHQIFSRMFSEPLLTIEDAYRAGPTTWNLVPAGNSNTYVIPGIPGSIFDRPIAVLLGPTCVSMGDLTAHRLRYHPMVRFFGKPPAAAFGDNKGLTGYSGWILHHSIGDMFHTSQPGVYLNRSEFPIDEAVWFTPESVAQGEDDVVKRALEWMSTLTYAHDVAVVPPYSRPGTDSVCITTTLSDSRPRPAATISAIVTDAGGTFRDSVLLYNDGLHGDGSALDSVWGSRIRSPLDEGVFNVSVRTVDNTRGTYRRLPNAALFTTAGPLTVDSVASFKSQLYSYWAVKPYIKNNGATWTMRGATVKLICDSPWVKSIIPESFPLTNILPGQRVSGGVFKINYDSSSVSDTCGVRFELSINGTVIWTADPKTLTGVGMGAERLVPTSFALEQNYPNPFNPTTTIGYTVGGTRHQASGVSNVRLSVFDILGREVALLVNEKKMPGDYEVKFDATGLSSGVYFYRLQAGSFVQTKRLVLVR